MKPLPQPIITHRTPLHHVWEKAKTGRLTLGFIGGSITENLYNWPEQVIAWFADQFPGVQLLVENVAIGATNSDLAVLRVQRDLIDRGCDLVFVEYAVNDNGMPTEERMRSREGLLRKLMVGGRTDLVLVYTYMQDHYEAMIKGEYPDSVSEFETLAEHYRLGSVWMGLHALNEVRRGNLRWEEWLPDGLHPSRRGAVIYADAVIAFLKAEKQRAGESATAGGGLPTPLNDRHWGTAELFPLTDVKTEGPWTIRRWPWSKFMEQVLETAAPGARMRFEFEGRGLALGFDFGKASSEFNYRLDGGDWVSVERDRPDWCGEGGWFRLHRIADDLAPGRHTMEIEVTHGNRPDCKGTNFRLALIGVVK